MFCGQQIPPVYYYYNTGVSPESVVSGEAPDTVTGTESGEESQPPTTSSRDTDIVPLYHHNINNNNNYTKLK